MTNEAHIDPDEFREVPTMAGYKVSTDGRIIGPSGILLKQRIDRDRRSVSVRVEGRCPSTVTVAKMVALAFVGVPPPKHEPIPIDGDTANVNASNLEWRPRVLNPLRMAGDAKLRGEGSPHTGLTDSDVLEIRAQAALGESHAKIARQFHISASSCSNIIARRRWSHI